MEVSTRKNIPPSNRLGRNHHAYNIICPAKYAGDACCIYSKKFKDLGGEIIGMH